MGAVQNVLARLRYSPHLFAEPLEVLVDPVLPLPLPLLVLNLIGVVRVTTSAVQRLHRVHHLGIGEGGSERVMFEVSK